MTCAHHQGTGRSQALRGEALAYYRFIDKPDNEAVTVENILQPHRHRTLQARREDGAVRAGQQHAELRETRKKGWASRTKTGTGGPRSEPARHGEHGGVAAEGSAGGVRRPAARRGEGQASREEEEVVPGEGHSAEVAAARRAGRRASREADFVDLFVERRERTPGVELLVRAKTNRVLGKDDGDKLFDKVRKSPVQGKLVVEGQASERAGQGQQAGREGRATAPPGYGQTALPQGRTAGEVQGARRTDACPRGKPASGPPNGGSLLTTLPSVADAERTWYGLAIFAS